MTDETKRSCGTCTLCCTLLPVREIKKESLTPCKHSTGQSCSIYEKRPASCKMWSCAWLTYSKMELPRPDISGYVIDILLDKIVLEHPDTKKTTDVNCIQIWVDPKRFSPQMIRSLEEFMYWEGENRKLATLFRIGSNKSVVVMPPALTPDNEWFVSPDVIIHPLPKETASAGRIEKQRLRRQKRQKFKREKRKKEKTEN